MKNSSLLCAIAGIFCFTTSDSDARNDARDMRKAGGVKDCTFVGMWMRSEENGTVNTFDAVRDVKGRLPKKDTKKEKIPGKDDEEGVTEKEKAVARGKGTAKSSRGGKKFRLKGGGILDLKIPGVKSFDVNGRGSVTKRGRDYPIRCKGTGKRDDGTGHMDVVKGVVTGS